MPEGGVPSLDTGLYLLSQEAPFDGNIKALNACAFLTEPDPNPQGTGVITLVYYAAGYWLVGSTFERIINTLSLFFNINVGETFGCNVVNIPNEQQPKVLKGDRPGVLIQQQECIQRSILPPSYVCSAHVNIIDPVKNCSQSLYFNNTRLVGSGLDMPAELNAINGRPVDVFINLHVIIGK